MVGEVAHQLLVLLQQCPHILGICIALRLDVVVQARGIAHHKVQFVRHAYDALEVPMGAT